MHFPSAVLQAVALSLLVPATHAAPAATAAVPFTKLFTVQVAVTIGLEGIEVPGGFRDVDTYQSGTITGSGFNGTIFGGIGLPAVYGGIVDTDVILYGKTNDGVPFLVEQTGIGSLTRAYSNIRFEIGGEYQMYSSTFLIADVKVSSDKKTVTATIYDPTNPA